MESTNQEDDELDSTFLVAIVVGSTGFVLMVLGGVYYLTRLGDVPSRKAVASFEDPVEIEDQQGKDDAESGASMTPATGSQQQQQIPPQSDSAYNFSPLKMAGSDPSAPREELIEIYAPAGKLGVILDTPGDGPPKVHEIRPTSVLKDEMQVGDRVIAIDDEDVRMMSANKVSSIISRKKDNTTRKFSIIRTITGKPESDVTTPQEKINNLPTTSDTHDNNNNVQSVSDDNASPDISQAATATDTHDAGIPREESFEIYAPAGKLGFVMQPNPGGPLTVHEIRPNSVLRDEIQIGDKVIALDDQDVQMMSPNEVSRLISRKAKNTTRKFSIIRTIG